MRSSRFVRQAASAASGPEAQLRKLYPLLASQKIISGGARPTAASLAIATMHAPLGAAAGSSHSEDCPVYRKEIPLSSVHDERTFAAKPCPLCLKQRVNYLASQVFCADFERRCSGGGAVAAAAATTNGAAVPEELAAEVAKHFSAFAALEEELRLFATSGMTPGRTWLVYRACGPGSADKGIDSTTAPTTTTAVEGKLSVVNLPSNKLPFAFGMWPLAVVNMTEETLCRAMMAMAERTVGAAVGEQPPAWSRAARSPAGRVALAAQEQRRAEGGFLTTALAAVRAEAAGGAVAALDWAFVAAQLREARAYFVSGARESARQGRRRARGEAAARDAMRNIKDSGKVVITHKGMELEGEEAAERTKTPAGEESKAPESAEPAAAAAPVAAAGSATASTTTTATTTTTTAATATASATGPTKTQLGDGTWEYRYPSGDVTLLLPDGTQVFRTADVTTTAYSSGNTLYEYANGSSILDRADGVRVTTYPDGASKDERVG